MHKKFLAVLLTGAMLVCLAACGGSAQNTGVDASGNTAEQSQQKPSSDASNNGGKALVAYFSHSGNTKKIAGLIAADTDAELFEIVTKDVYPETYEEVLEVARAELDDDVRPELSSHIENVQDYAVIYLGWPCWWGDCPRAILSFLGESDFSGKTIIPFTTSGGSGFANSLTSVSSAAPGAVLLEGLSVRDDEVDAASSDVSDWLENLAR